MKSQEMLQHTLSAIARCRIKLAKGTAERFDADELDRWISILYRFRDVDYIAARKTREEVCHVIFIALTLKASIEKLHPALLFTPVMRRVTGYETRYYGA